MSHPSAADILVEALGSRGRVRILYVLAKMGRTSMTRLAREARLGYESTRDHVAKLAKLGLVEERRVGRIVLVRLSDHPLADRIRALFAGL